MVIHLQTSLGQDSLVTVPSPFLWSLADTMREVTDAVLIMVLPLKSLMSSSLCNVSEIKVKIRISAITLAKLGLVEEPKLSPVGRG